MKKKIKSLWKVEKLLKAKNKELSDVENPLNAYYEKIAPESHRMRDAQEIRYEIKDLLSQKYSLLESIQIELNKEKFRVSNKERKLTLIKNNHENNN